LKLEDVLPPRRPATAQVPKPGLGVGRYNYMQNSMVDGIMFQKKALSARLGPGYYRGVESSLGVKSHNRNALDSERRRQKMLVPTVAPPTQPRRAERGPEDLSLMRRAQQLLAQMDRD